MATITTIPDNQCIGDSLVTINNNFNNLNTSIVSLSSQYTNTTPGVADAWVVFDGKTGGTATIKSQYNISSVTRNSVGNYTITFATPMNNTNYAVAGLNSAAAAGLNMSLYSSAGPGEAPTGLTTNSFQIVFGNGTNTYDTKYASVIIYSL
jgi:hypothetical protein